MTTESNQSCTVHHSESAPSAAWMLTLPIHINGQGPYRVSVDTGAGRTVMMPDVAEELGLEIIGTEERRGVGGAVSIELASVQSVAIGSIQAQPDMLGFSSFLQRLGGEGLRGNLGYDVLHCGRLTVDFSGQHIAFESSDTNPIQGAPFAIASAKKPLVTVDTLVNGTGPHRFAVDTGSMGTCIAPGLARHLGASKGTPVQAAGVGGMMEAYFTAEAILFRIGEDCMAEVTPVVLDVFDHLAPETGLTLSGIIGRDILKQYVVTIDYPRSVIRFA